MPLTELCCQQVFITLAELFISPSRTMILCVYSEECFVKMQAIMLAWWLDGHNAIDKVGAKRGQAGSWWDPLFQGLLVNLPSDHIPGVVAIMGMPLRFHPYDHGRLALNEIPYPAFDDFLSYSYFFFYSSFAAHFFFLCSITHKGGFTLLKSGEWWKKSYNPNRQI